MRGELSETQERLDFTERLLSQARRESDSTRRDSCARSACTMNIPHHGPDRFRCQPE